MDKKFATVTLYSYTPYAASLVAFGWRLGLVINIENHVGSSKQRKRASEPQGCIPVNAQNPGGGGKQRKQARAAALARMCPGCTHSLGKSPPPFGVFV